MKLLPILALCACASSHGEIGVDGHVPPPPDGTVAIDAAADADTGPGCGADAECASGACDESTGACIDEARVLFVATTGSDAGTCTRTQPCATLGRAAQLLAPGRDAIAIAAGAYAGDFTIAAPALISGPSRDPRAVELSSPDHASIVVTLNTAAFTVEGVSIGGNSAMNAPQAVQIGMGADVTFDRVVVHDNYDVSVFVEAAKLTARRYEAFGSQYGVLADYTSTLDVDRTYVHDNTFAGLAAANAYTIVNTMFVHNSIGFIPFNNNTGVLDFDTFAAQTSTVISTTFAIAANDDIFANNQDAPSMPVAITYSLFTGATTAGTGNFVGDPAFVDAAHGDYHIGPTSAAIDRADPAATLATDFDGGPRPTGAARDVGADERP